VVSGAVIERRWHSPVLQPLSTSGQVCARAMSAGRRRGRTTVTPYRTADVARAPAKRTFAMAWGDLQLCELGTPQAGRALEAFSQSLGHGRWRPS
jgi:hypothetical protein